MNQHNITHMKALARHIREQAQYMVNRMASLESAPNGDFTHVPVVHVVNIFNEMRTTASEFQTILDDMLPHFEAEPLKRREVE